LVEYSRTTVYPFVALVGQETLKKALLVTAVNPEIGGLLIRGPSGCAKSTAVRGLAALLPEIFTVADCAFRCDPDDPSAFCAACRERAAAGEELPVAGRSIRMVDLPLNATEDRVSGGLDVSRALMEGVKALEPGLLALANRGILYVDEINLLDDHIVDLLLDAAAMGVNVVEREGVSVAHPARFMLIGTMNPEEGELRPQIADRLGLQVEIQTISDPEQRVEIMKRREDFAGDAAGFAERYRGQTESLQEALSKALSLVRRVQTPDAFYSAVAELTRKMAVNSHRADLSIHQCAKALAALDGRETVTAEDIREAAVLALGHRVDYDPFVSGPQLDLQTVRRHLEDILEAGEVKKKPIAKAAP
jgi:Mg-chelatase subunit ChlI